MDIRLRDLSLGYHVVLAGSHRFWTSHSKYQLVSFERSRKLDCSRRGCVYTWSWRSGSVDALESPGCLYRPAGPFVVGSRSAVQGGIDPALMRLDRFQSLVDTLVAGGHMNHGCILYLCLSTCSLDRTNHRSLGPIPIWAC